MDAKRNILLAAALRYAELGYPVFPVKAGAKKPPLTAHSFKDASTDPAVIEAWWAQWPNANVAIATAGLVIIDPDVNEDGSANMWLAAQPERQLELAAGPMAATPRGGSHHYFRAPAGKRYRCSESDLAPGVDVRADGGYVVVEPSSTPDGSYRWMPGAELDVPPDQLPEPPAWLLAELDRVDRGEVASTGERSSESSASNPIPKGRRNSTLASLAGAMRHVGMSEPEIFAAIWKANADRCQPPLPEKDVRRIAASIAKYPPDQVSVAVAEDHWAQDREQAQPVPRSVRQVIKDHPNLRKAIIEGLLREGETANVIAPAKTGKSWLVIGLAIAVAAGKKWLDEFETVKGDVLIIDNELHGETIAHRIPKVAKAMGVELEAIADTIYVETLRGSLKDLVAMGPYFEAIEPGRFKVIILDAFYRFLPEGTDENDNAAMAKLYNFLDRHAARLRCAFVLIHHASKGNQSNKSVTDSGSGAQSRACDTHLVLRAHEEKGIFVLDAAIRSWKPIEPRCLEWAFPTWKPAPGFDPALLKPERLSRAKKPADPAKAPPHVWTVAEFAKKFVGAKPVLMDEMILAAQSEGISKAAARSLLAVAIEKGLAFRWRFGHSERDRFARVEKPLTATSPPQEKGGGARARPPVPPRSRQSGPGAGVGKRARKPKPSGRETGEPAGESATQGGTA